MAEFPDVLPPIVGPDERPGLGIRTRYGVTLEPSEELNELITSFLRPEAVRRVVGLKAIRLSIADHPVEVNLADKSDAYLLSAVTSYARSTAKYKKGQNIQFRLADSGFGYEQTRNNNGASTSLSFQIATSPMMRGDIMRPPFFKNADHDLTARIVFPSQYVVSDADAQAEIVERAMHYRHPSARNGLANFSLSLSGLKVLGREVRPASALRIVRPGDEA